MTQLFQLFVANLMRDNRQIYIGMNGREMTLASATILEADDLASIKLEDT